ncbi:HD domain-containing protein [bacterium]|nr:HD domain-containing protein [bacterium]
MNSLEFLNKYCSGVSELNRKVLVRHSNLVLKESLKIADRHPELNVDITKLINSAILHDIGVCGLTKQMPYIYHGVMGKKILLKSSFKNIASVCERHIGSGITKEEAIKLGLPRKDMLPKTIEEKIVCYADKFYSKSKSGKHTIHEIRNEFSNYGQESLLRFNKLHDLLS